MSFNYTLGNNSSNNKTVSSPFSPNFIFKRILFDQLNMFDFSRKVLSRNEDNVSYTWHDNYISDLAKQLFYRKMWKD